LGLSIEEGPLASLAISTNELAALTGSTAAQQGIDPALNNKSQGNNTERGMRDDEMHSSPLRLRQSPSWPIHLA
jgi:hypothetical protein